ncbi:MAG: GxxExxY protein [Pirellulales bacterium]|nr:GxxExxY protein [Pirellulales bacterium]
MAEGHSDEINRISERIIGCAFSVSNSLGAGFLEKVYENALAHELRKAGFDAKQQESIRVFYDGVEVGYYVADILVNDTVLIEVKAAKAIDDVHFAQCMNYLKATSLKLCLLLNFGTPKIGIKRIVHNL